MNRVLLFLFVFLAFACSPLMPREANPSFPILAMTATPTTLSSPDVTIVPSPTYTITPSPLPPTPTPNSSPASLGPDLEQFPQGYNPLTGLPASDPEALALPALLVSLSHFPPSVRPQTGLSFAAQVYEIYITEGMTRFLAVFYGDFPRAIPNLSQTSRQEPISLQGSLLGNRIWWDENGDGIQQPGEVGLGGVRVDLLDAQGNLIANTVTDGNGYYAFNPPAGEYFLQVSLPAEAQVSPPDRTDDEHDSDADANGKIGPITFQETDLNRDIGLIIPANQSLQVTLPGTDRLMGFETQATTAISGVRSAREAYVPIVNAFPNGCLIAASKSKEVNVNICRNVYTSGNVNQAGISVEAMRALAQANRDPNRPLNYSGNLFRTEPPGGGQEARQLNVFYSWLNQAQWRYDTAAGGYWRFHDYADPNRVGQFTPALDRLTGRPVLFENLVILFVEHVPRTSTIINLNMGPGSAGRAIVFRNGMVYTDVRWSMVSEEYERRTGLARPLRLRYPDGSPFPLAPGHTWFHVVTPGSTLTLTGEGVWKLTFLAPAGTR